MHHIIEYRGLDRDNPDIEAVQEGAERWGADDDDNDGKAKDDGRPARRLVRGAKNYDFLSSDGEETD